MVKEQVRAIVERLPRDATWDDVMHELYVEATEGLATTTERRPGEKSERKRRDRR